MTVNIIDFGASTDNDDNAPHIQKAIDSLNSGGTVIIPTGIFTTGALELKSNICIYLEHGATLKAHGDISKYRFNGYLDSFGKETNSLIIAKNCTNITFCGTGTIDLNGSKFVDFSVPSNVSDLSPEEMLQTPARPLNRPRRPILFDCCRGIKLKDITIIDSPCWTFTMHNCTDIFVNNISVLNNQRIPHNDGIHMSACKNAIISGCNFVCGDDCIAITSLFDYALATDGIVISDCVLSSRSAALRIGHISSVVKNISVNNLIINNTNRGIAIFAGQNGNVENVIISDVIMQTKLFKGEWWGKGEPFVICTYDSNGAVRNIKLNQISAVSENSAIIAGNNIENVDINNVDITVDFDKYKDDKYELCPNGFAKKTNNCENIVYIK